MPTIFQKLAQRFGASTNNIYNQYGDSKDYSGLGHNDVIYSTDSKQDYEKRLLQLRQQRVLAKHWKKALNDSQDIELNKYSDLQLMLKEVELMGQTPEIGAALDIYMEETCLTGETKIDLLNETPKTIKSLCSEKRINFWTTAIDEFGNYKPALIDGVVYKGIQNVWEITLNDNTTIKATPNHKWLIGDNTWKKTSDLCFGDQLMIIPPQTDEPQFTATVVSVTELEHKEAVYDLLNSTTNSCFGVVCNNYSIVSHNCTTKNGIMINVNSKSERIKNILQDLIYNRLSGNTIIPMIARSTVQYGNTYMLLNITEDNGIIGWKLLPPHDMRRFENGMNNPYNNAFSPSSNIDIDKHDSTKFVWVGKSDPIGYNNWEIAHFRLLYETSYLPYGCSLLNKARRIWHALTKMEDMMLLYRLERSVERRVYKIDVGGLDPQDVAAYMDEVTNKFKRTPVVDPLTGQLDLRKNIMPVWKKTPIPLTDGRTITIEELAKEFEEGKENHVYSIQDQTLQIVHGRVIWCGKNYTAEAMIKITINNNTFAIMAPEHEVLLKNGKKIQARNLEVGDFIMPFFNKKIFNPSDNFTKVKKIEYISGDDVYCMTVKGLNGEDDRHNFAIRTFTPNNTWDEQGIFVSNCQTDDYFIPVRDNSDGSSIENLPAGQNMTAIEDIKYMQNKLCAALRIPRSFLNFEDASGDGKNLSMMDVRFSRNVNRIQQMLLMELNKVCIIHLYLLGFEDDLTNFQLSMNTPSQQSEMLELDNFRNKIQIARDAVSDTGNGLPLMSVTRACKEILGWTDSEVRDNLEEIRIEKAISSELEKTNEIITHTGIFNKVDNLYGNTNANYNSNSESNTNDNDNVGNIGSGGSIGGGFSASGDTFDMDSEGEGDITGEEGTQNMEDTLNDEMPEETPNDNNSEEPQANDNEPLQEINKPSNSKNLLIEQLLSKKENEDAIIQNYPLYQKNFLINEELDKMAKELGDKLEKDNFNNKEKNNSNNE